MIAGSTRALLSCPRRMPSYEALYRKYRPQTFRDLAGQDPVASTLRNEVRSGRLGHAYLFTGPRGTGKTTTARLLAKALNCVRGPTPDPCDAPVDRGTAGDPAGLTGECPQCQAVRLGSHIDVVEIDAASNRGIEDIRSLQERVRLAPVQGRYKVFIIDEVHMLTDPAWNALLKTLEEPPPSCVFILATTEVHKVLPTVLSRCQRLDFQRIKHASLVERLEQVARAEGLIVEPDALEILARRADGGLRDALSLLDQVSAGIRDESATAITAALVSGSLGLIPADAVAAIGDALAARDAASAIVGCNELLAAGHDHRAVLRELLGWVRNVLLLQLAPDRAEALEIPPGQRERIKRHVATFSHLELLLALEIIRETDQQLKGSVQPTIWLEMGILRLCDRAELPSLLELADRVAALEARIEGQAGASMPRAAASPPPAPIRSPVATSPVVTSSVASSPGLPAAQPLAPPSPAAASSVPVAPIPGRDALAAFREATRSLPISKLKNLDQFLVDASRRSDGTLVVYLKNDKLFKEGSDGYKALLPLVRQCFGEGTSLEISTDPPGERAAPERLLPPSPAPGPPSPEPPAGGSVAVTAPIAPAAAASEPAPDAPGDPSGEPVGEPPPPRSATESDRLAPGPGGSAAGDAVALASELLLGKVIDG